MPPPTAFIGHTSGLILMRMAIVIHSMQAGGAERVTANLTAAWVREGWDVHVVTMTDRETDFYRLGPEVSRYSLGLARDSARTVDAVVTNGRRLLALLRTLRVIRPDVVVAMMTTSGVLAIVACRLLRIPVIVEEHTYPPQLPLGRMWETLRSLTYPFASRIVLLTSEGLAWLNRRIPRAEGMIIPNPIEFPLPSGEPHVEPAAIVAPEARLLLAVGRLDSGKQVNLLIEAFAAIASRHPTWSLAIVGDGPDRDRLRDQIEITGLGTRIALVGRVGNVADWYQRADIYVMTSRFEGFPNTLAEALAHGCASVSYDCDTGPRDLIRDGVDGSLVRPVSDVAALEAALDSLMGGDSLREEMGRRAIEVRERYAPERVLGLWRNLLTAVVPRSGGPVDA